MKIVKCSVKHGDPIQAPNMHVTKDLSWGLLLQAKVSGFLWICITREITQEGRALTSGKGKTKDKHNKLLFEIQRATVELLL